MRPFARSGRPISLAHGPDFLLKGHDRERVASAIGPFLGDPGRLDEALDRTEDAIRTFVFWKQAYAQVREGPKKPLATELERFSPAAAEVAERRFESGSRLDRRVRPT